MIIPNNKNLDTAELQDRLRMEAAAIARANVGERAPLLTRGGSNARLEQPRLSWFRRLLSWGWSIVLARELRIASEQAKRQLDLHEQTLERHAQTIDRHEQTIEQLRAEVTQLTRSQAQTAEELAATNSDQTKRLADLHREILFQQRRLSRLNEHKLNLAENNASPVYQALTDSRHDALYVAFEDVFRGARADIKSRLLPYVAHLNTAGAGQPDRPILDIGCGRGEWLEILKDHRLTAYGIDTNAMMIECAHAAGLEVRHADLMTHLRELTDGSLSAVTAFHVVEHLPFPVLIDALDEILRVLSPGGVLILETPNPETLRVGATTFYNDPTHLHPIPPNVLEFFVKNRGFEDVQVMRLHPFEEGRLTSQTPDAELLNALLFGPQDYAVTGRRG